MVKRMSSFCQLLPFVRTASRLLHVPEPAFVRTPAARFHSLRSCRETKYIVRGYFVPVGGNHPRTSEGLAGDEVYVNERVYLLKEKNGSYTSDVSSYFDLGLFMLTWVPDCT